MTADDSRLRALIALAKRMAHGESARRDAASFVAFEERMERAQRGRRFRHLSMLLGSAALVAAVGFLVVLARGTERFDVFAPAQHIASHAAPEPSLTYAVETLAAASTQDVGQSGVRNLRFSDGSRVTLESSAAAQVAELTGRGANVLLAHGAAEVSIAKRKNAAWRFQAGPYTVRVTGTAFKLTWSAEAETVEVGMHHGSVIVTGPLAPQGVALHAGQRLVASGRDRRLLVEDWAPAAEAKLVTADATDEVLPSARAAQRTKGPSREAAHAEHDWAKKVAQGNFAGVLREAKQLGYARLLETAVLPDLGALADAARYARQNVLGRNALLALRERFPESAMGRDAAFFLGRLSSDQSALRWYDRYLSEQPDGAYVSQALGRSMMLRFERGDHEEAARLAARYLSRFPSGPYAGSAQKLSDPARANRPAP